MKHTLPPRRQICAQVQTLHPFRETTRELTLAEMPERLAAVWGPVERILDEMEQTGEIDAARGKPVFYESEHRDWYEVAPALQGLIDVHALAAQRLSLTVDMVPLQKLATKFDVGAPIFPEDLAKARLCIAACKRMDARMTVAQAQDLIQTVQIQHALAGHWRN